MSSSGLAQDVAQDAYSLAAKAWNSHAGSLKTSDGTVDWLSFGALAAGMLLAAILSCLYGSILSLIHI